MASIFDRGRNLVNGARERLAQGPRSLANRAYLSQNRIINIPKKSLARAIQGVRSLTGFGDLGNPEDGKGIGEKFKRGSRFRGRRLLSPQFGHFGFRGIDRDEFGFDRNELFAFNPTFITTFHQRLMKRSVFPRMALLILKAALSQRQFVVEGDDPRVESFHQRWINKILPEVMRKTPNAVWFGWQPFVLDWKFKDGMWSPNRLNDVDPFDSEALRDEDTGRYVGLQTEDGRFAAEKSFWVTWEEEQGDPYGLGQSITVFPYWLAASRILVWKMRYFQRSVDPVRIAFAKNISSFTGTTDSAGNEIKIDLTELVAEALDAADGGDSVALPLDEAADGGPQDLVNIETLEMPDRAEQWASAIEINEQRQFLGTLNFPGASIQTDKATFASSRTAEKPQLSILEFVSDLVLDKINEDLIPLVHTINNLPGDPPKAKGRAFKREQEETLRELLKSYINESVPEVDPEGKKTGKQYRVGDLVRWPLMLKGLDIAGFDPAEVARSASEIMPAVAPSKGGRPQNPLGDRAEDRQSGLDR